MTQDGGDEKVGQLLEQLAGLARIASRRLFGGVGLYSGRRLFGMVVRGAVYLRADEGMRRDFARRGAGPFRTYRGREVPAFWQVPEALASEKRRIRALARRALAATDKLAGRSLVALPALARPLARPLFLPPSLRRPVPGRRR